MKVTVKSKLGSAEYLFEIEEKNDLDVLHKIAVLGNPPTFCDECKNDNPNMFRLVSNKDTEGNTYVNVRCEKCGSNAKLGLYKSGGFFFHPFKKYIKNEK